MPELKHNFLKGRMNKDLDERLVPNGEYRDALNVEVSNSEGSDVGAVQTTMGNINRSEATLLGLQTGGFCVGSIADEKNDKLYWLISGGSKDIIAEYDYNSNAVVPVLVDTWVQNSTLSPPIPRVLNFNANSYVTGINIIDDMLFWTDNETEPKGVNITRCKFGSLTPSATGTPDFLTHTDFLTTDPFSTTTPPGLWLGDSTASSRPIREEHITVIKESPKTALTLEMKNTSHPHEIGGTVVAIDTTFFDSNGDLLKVGETTDISLIAAVFYEINDILILTATNDDGEDLEVRVKIDSLLSPQGIQFGVTILAIHSSIVLTDELWDIELDEKAAVFQFKFPRFAYRYKYEDGEYSTFSPFTEVAFLPNEGNFDYLPKKGFNLSMVNDIRFLAVKDFVAEEDLLPDGVIEIDILYKESNSPNIYTVKTLKRDSAEWNTRSALAGVPNTSSTQTDLINPPHALYDTDYNHTKGYVKITSEMIHAVLPSNQLLRPWDNVPRKALAQEITGNRLVYGNYLQNYNVPHQSIKIGFWQGKGGEAVEFPNSLLPEQIYPIKAYDYYPAKSVKSLRTYQLGVVYRDKYGRETPVFSADDNNKSSIYLEKSHANKQNKLTGQIASPTIPEWAVSFKFFIKETSNEYYNLAVDRWYDAQDDNVWISFPSSERNKVDIDTFLILKKEHDTSDFVTERARYKILAIENEAPIYIKEKRKSFGEVTNNTANTVIGGVSGDGFPLVDRSFIWVAQSEWEDRGWNETLADKINLYIRVRSATVRSKWYAVSSISLNTAVGGNYQVDIDGTFGVDMGFTSTNNSFATVIGGLSVEIMQKITENKPEFDGRFFVKIHRDLTLQNRLVSKLASAYYGVAQARTTPYINSRSTYCHSGTYDTGSSSNVAWFGYNLDRYDTSASAIPRRFQIEHHKVFHAYGPLWAGFYQLSNPTWGTGGPQSGAVGHRYWKEISHHGKVDVPGGWFIDGQQAFHPVKWDWEGGLWVEALAPGTAKSYPRAFNGNWEYPDGSAGYSRPSQSYQKHSYASREIRRDSSQIHLSHSGHGCTVALNYNAGSAYSAFWWDYDGKGNSKDGGCKVKHTCGGDEVNFDNLITKGVPLGCWGSYVAEEHFINTLSTGGTLWRWREDPDQIIYQTDLSPNLWHTNVWNYHDFKRATDSLPYPIPTTGSWTGSSTGGPSTFQKIEDFFSRADNRRTRYRFNAHTLGDINYAGGPIVAGQNPGTQGQGYLPTNPPNFVGRSDSTLNPLKLNYQIKEWDNSGNIQVVDLRPEVLGCTAGGTVDCVPVGASVNTNHPLYRIDDPTNNCPTCQYVGGFDPSRGGFWGMDHSGDMSPNNPMGYPPGIRHDGMRNGEYAANKIDQSGGLPGVMSINLSEVGDGDNFPGEVTWEILEIKDESEWQFASRNPAIFETEPKEDVGLDIYYEIGQTYPITLDSTTNEQYIPIGSIVTSPVGIPTDTRVHACNDNTVTLVDDTNTNVTSGITSGDTLWFVRADGSATSAIVNSVTGAATGVYGLNPNVWEREMRLPWFNCYSFGNGVESDRIRDDFNQVTIDNGPKASTTLDEPYMEERRSSGLIYSGIYNSQSGINNLNQFIQAEKITKDLNPTYGSIQKLHTRNTNLVTLCEDKILKVLANKDALYNADGSANLTATENVLGQTTPFVGEYGISKNPESFAKESYRLYFSDKTRGSVLRLSQDGITPISNAGMRDYFSDNLRTAGKIVGSFDDKKQSYNITLRDRLHALENKTISFTEDVKGWSSFKSFIQENGLSMNNTYYTFNSGQLWEHHANETRNSYYDDDSFDSYVRVLLNEQPGSVKSFGTLNYEGSQAKNTPDTGDVEYYNNFLKYGWYVEEIFTNLQNGISLEFKDKEGKWFSKIKGETTEWLDDGKAGNIDTQEFSYQGIGNADAECPECTTSWECVSSIQTVDSCENLIYAGAFATDEEFMQHVSNPINNLTTTPFDEIYACVGDRGAAPGSCPCGSSSWPRSHKISPKMYLDVDCQHQPGWGDSISAIDYTTWENYLNSVIIGAPSALVSSLGLTSTMTYNQFNTALTGSYCINSPNMLEWGVVESDYCACSQDPVCECIEKYGNQGFPTKIACESGNNCCNPTHCGCTDPCASNYDPGATQGCNPSNCIFPPSMSLGDANFGIGSPNLLYPDGSGAEHVGPPLVQLACGTFGISAYPFEVGEAMYGAHCTKGITSGAGDFNLPDGSTCWTESYYFELGTSTPLVPNQTYCITWAEIVLKLLTVDQCSDCLDGGWGVRIDNGTGVPTWTDVNAATDIYDPVTSTVATGASPGGLSTANTLYHNSACATNDPGNINGINTAGASGGSHSEWNEKCITFTATDTQHRIHFYAITDFNDCTSCHYNPLVYPAHGVYVGLSKVGINTECPGNCACAAIN